MSAPRDGFSLIEVIVAMLILTVGILAMGATTGHVLNQVRGAELRTDRMVAVQQVAETLRGTPWNGLQAACASPFEGGGDDRYTITCSVNRAGNLARIQLISEGPGLRGGRVDLAVVDTLMITIARP